MIKKLQLLYLTLFSSVLVNSQTNALQNTCLNQAPPQQWEEWMNKAVEQFKQNQASGKTQLVTYDIPVIVHVIHFGEPDGTFPNIDSNQIKTQLQVLNDDFAGVGLNSASIPTVFAGRFAGNTGIRFCRAKTNPTGGNLPQRGIDRTYNAAAAPGGLNPNAVPDIVSYMNTVVIPATLWDPTKYFNIWISDRSPTLTINGFATYPAGTSLGGLTTGGPMGTAVNDGVWIWTKAFGTIGTLSAPYDEGRTLTHETGHWLGLRHMWGDGNCLSDYCNDTPPAKTPNTGCPTFPANIDRCGVGQSQHGEMYMNFMDRTDDNCMSLFTIDQSVRMLTALSQCPNRNLLGTHGICAASTDPSVTAVASFSISGPPCVNRAFTPMNTSSGWPAPTYIWSSSPPAVFSPGPTVANPAITFNTTGSYTLTLVATNTVNNSSFTMAVNATTCTPLPLCIDTIMMIKSVDSLATYKALNSSIVVGCLPSDGFAGYISGTNCYKDKEYAQYYPPSSYSATPYPQVNSVIVLFDANGTKTGGSPASQIACKIYGGSINNGPVSVMASKQESLPNIVGTPGVFSIQYVGLNTVTFATPRIIPYRFDFGPSVIINNPNSGFFAAVEVPSLFTGDSIRIFGNTKYNATINDSSSWALTYNNVWKPLKSYRSSKIQLAILPQITCSPIVGLKEASSAFNSNVNVMPNPNNGVFSLVFTFPNQQDLFVRIYNAVGQEISVTKMQNVTSNVVDVDLSNKPDGIYFTEISNGTERVVKKIIINH